MGKYFSEIDTATSQAHGEHLHCITGHSREAVGMISKPALERGWGTRDSGDGKPKQTSQGVQ